jgi:glycosyltransferase involved in cell wall biosynthesis
MKVLIFNESDIDGGAARAAYRLHQGLQNIAVQSQMAVRAKFSGDRTVLAQKTALTKLGPPMDGLPLRFYRDRSASLFSTQWFPDSAIATVRQLNPDVINLHWICNGYLNIQTLPKLNKPLVWTVHDMWPFTGGCHYSGDCQRYLDSCGACPQLNSHRSRDLSRWVWQRKAKAWNALNLTMASPSRWMARQIQASSLFREVPVEVFPNGIDLQRYQPREQAVVRDLLNLPTDKHLILFGAGGGTSDLRKGFPLLQAALQRLGQTEWRARINLVVFGSLQPETPLELGFPVHYMGKLGDDLSLALVYAAADVFVAPSVQENLSNTVLEAIACGTPCVAFNIGGMPDLIEHEENGYLAKPYDVDNLAQGIVWVLEHPERHQTLCKRAREKAEQEFSQELQAQRYRTLFARLADKSGLAIAHESDT